MGRLKDKKLVVLGMSGGVDSSVSLMLLKQSGYKVIGVSLKYDIWRCAKRSENVCCSKESFDIAKKICASFGCEHHVLNVSSAFKSDVIEYFKSELAKNRTPSPCVFCNPKIKFKALIDYADRVGAQFVATGHYARTEYSNGRYLLTRARDLSKDQTYSLSFLNQNQLSRIIFPLGELSKEEVYDISRKNTQLDYYQKIKQSQDFCFLGKDQLDEFIDKEIKPKSGPIEDRDGQCLGEHKGLQHYTIGQRKGIMLPGGPYYVVDKVQKGNVLVVSKDVTDLQSRGAILKPYNLIDTIIFPVEVEAKLRSSQDLFSATINSKNDRLELVFNEPQSSVTLGQIAVFYKNNRCLGAGVISAKF